MIYNIVIHSDKEELDSAIFKVYLDIKKKKYIKKQLIPVTLTELDCDCDSKIKYCVKSEGDIK